MQRFCIGLALICCLAAGAACQTVTPAPGADKVKVTHNSADVVACTAAGNIKVPRNANGVVDMATAETEFRNQAVGLGGNAALVTVGAMGIPAEGIAYKCP
jgi:hypothetical protein